MASSDRLSIFRSRQFAPTANPPAGTNFLYPKADGKWYTRDSAGVETLVGPGAAGATTDASLLTSGTLSDARLTARLRGGNGPIADFDTIVTAGWYSADTTTAHPPFASSSWNLMVIPNTATGWVTQIAYEIQSTPGNNAPTIWTRQSNGGGAWAAWRRMDPEYLTNATNLSSGTVPDARLSTRLQTLSTVVTDLNTAVSAGWYAIAGAAGANTPTTQGFYNVLVLNYNAAGSTTQLAHEVTGLGAVGSMYVRQQIGNAWGAWRQHDPEYLRNATNLSSGTVPDARLPARLNLLPAVAPDLNTASAAGWYSANNTSSNTPVAGNSFVVQVFPYDASNLAQVAYDVNTTRAWVRNQNSGVWGIWRRTDPESKTDKDSTASASMRSQAMLTGGGTLAVDFSNNISWSQRFVANNKGSGTQFSTVGYFDITMPANGTIITGVGGAPNQTVAGGVINLPSWTSLYYILPISSGSASVTANFRLVLNSSALVIPDHWVEVVELNSDNLQFRWANGVTLYQGRSWSALDPRASVALGNVDNTSDANKPISTAVQTALNLKNASGLPTYAGARTNPFNAATSWYNLTPATQHIIRATMAKADVQRVRITAMGHSMLAGAFASQVGSTDTVATLRRYLGGLGANIGGTGVVKIANNTTQDYRWVLTGTWSRPNGSAPNDTADPFASTTSSFAVATFNSDMPGTVVDVHTFDNTAPIAIYVDDVLMETYAPAGTGANVTRTYTGLANTKHVVKIAPTTAGTAYLVGVNVRKTIGVEVSNMGQAGSSAADWAAGVNYINRQVAMADAPPHIAILQLDTNEVLWGGPTPIATYKTNYGNLIAAIQATGAAVIMVASPPATGGNGANGYPAVSQATWESYVTAEYDLADQYNVALLDLNHLFINQATASTDGLWGDPIHLNDYGYGLVARSLGTSAVWGQSNDKALDQQISLTAEYTSNQPATPATGLTLFSRFRARRIPAFVGPSGQDTHLQPALFSNMTAWVKAVNNAQSPTADGISVTQLSNGSTATTAVANAATSFFTSLVRYRCVTTAVAGTGAGSRSTNPQWMLSSTANKGGFFFVARFGFNLIAAGSRFFVGMSTTTTALSPSADPSSFLNMIGFGFDAADANLQFMRNDASGVATKVDLGANFAKGTGGTNFYEVRLFSPSGGGQQVYYSIQRLNDGYVVNGASAVTTKLPAIDTLMNFHLNLSNGAVAAVHSVDVQSIYIETDN